MTQNRFVWETGGILRLSICEKHIWPAFKLLLSAGTPLQKLIDRGGETHLFLNEQAAIILKNDKRRQAYNIINSYRTFIDLGNLWADKGWKCFAHYYRPENGKGIIPWISAVTEGINYFNSAINKWKKGSLQESMFFLGATAHIVQDMCVPHHAMGIAFNGHRRFELWAMNNKSQFRIENYGTYRRINGINELIYNNAFTSQHYYHDVSDYNNNSYIKAGKELLYLAQITTAQLFDYFIRLVSNDKI